MSVFLQFPLKIIKKRELEVTITFYSVHIKRNLEYEYKYYNCVGYSHVGFHKNVLFIVRYL